MIRIVKQYYPAFILRIEQFSRRKYWRLWLLGAMALYVLLVAFPSFDLLNKDFAPNWDTLFQKAQHPLTPQEHAPESHASKMAFRLLIPVLIHIFHLNTAAVLCLQLLAGMLSWLVVILLVEKYSGDKITAVILAFALAATGFCRATFNITGAFFDNFAFLFLLLPFLFPNSLVIFCSITLAAWVDERGLITSSFLLTFLLLHDKTKHRLIRILSIFLAWAGYFGLRIYLTKTFQLSTPLGGMGPELMLLLVNNWVLGIMSGLEGFWLLLLPYAYYMLKDSRRLEMALFTGNLLLIMVVALSVVDISRSMYYLFLGVPAMLCFISQKETTADLRKLATLVLVLCLLFPAYAFSGSRETYWSFPMPFQLFRMLFMSS